MGPALLEGKRWEFIIKAICCVATSSVDHLTVTDKVYECELIRQKSCMQMLCVWKCVWICVCSQCHPTERADKTLKSGNGGGHMRKSRVCCVYSAWYGNVDVSDTHQGTHYTSIIQAQDLNVTELYPFNRKQNLFLKRHDSSNTSQAAINQK